MIGAGGGGRIHMVTLPRDFFKAYASKMDLNKNHKKQGIFSQKPAKNAPKSMIFLFYPFVTKSLKPATSQIFSQEISLLIAFYIKDI